MDPSASRATCVGFPQPLSSPSVSRDSCALDSVPEVHPLCRRLVSTGGGVPGTPSASRGLGALVSAPRAGLCVAGLVWTCVGSLCPPSVLRGICALASPHCLCAAQVCMPPLYDTPVPHFAPAVFVCPVTLGHLGPASVLQGLCALAGFVCHCRFPEPAICLGSHCLSCELAQKCSVLCLLLSKSLL